MKKDKVLFFWFAFLLIFNSTLIYAENNISSAPLDGLTPLLPSNVTTAATVSVNDELGVLYSKKGKLWFSKGKNKALVDSGNIYYGGLHLHKNDKWLYALWWDKTKKGKTLQIRSSSDNGQSFSVDNDYIAKKGVLPVLTLADDGADKLAIAYITERSAGYQLYFNHSLNAGKTWLKSDLRINKLFNNKGFAGENEKPSKETFVGSHVSSPFLTYLDKELILIWQEAAILDGKDYLRVMLRVSRDDGETWSDEVEVYKTSKVQPQEMVVNKFDGQIFINLYIPTKGLLTFVASDKKGFNSADEWKKLVPVPDTQNLKSLSYIHSVYSSDKLFIGFVQTDDGATKARVRYVFYDKPSAKWVDISDRVTHKAKEDVSLSKSVRTKSTLPIIDSFLDQTVVAAWEEYSYLVPSVFINYSTDGGKNWQEEPLVVAPPGKVISKFPTFVKGKEKLWLVFTYYDPSSGDRRQSLYVVKLLGLDKGKLIRVNVAKPLHEFVSKLSESDKLKLLKKRVKEFWAFRVKGDSASAYEFFDPLYRSQFPKPSFIQTQGKIKYLKADIGDIKVNNNLATVKSKITLSVSLLGQFGQQTEASTPRIRELEGRWGWFYDNWYLMPFTLFDNRFKY